MKGYISPILVFLAAVFWGISGFFVRELGSLGFSTFEIVFLRMLIACIFITTLFAIIKKDAFKIKLKDLWCFFGTGAVGSLGCSLCYFTTMKNASLSTACILMYTSPIFVVTLSFFLFKERLTFLKVGGLILAFIGCILCSYEKGGFVLSLPTFIVGVGSGLCYGSYSIFSRYAINKGYSTDTILIYTFIFAFLGSCVFTPYDLFISHIPNLLNATPYLLGLGFLATAVPYTLYTAGLKNMENGKASIIACMEIVASIVVGLIAYQEIPSYIKIIGIIIVFASVFLLNFKPHKHDAL